MNPGQGQAMLAHEMTAVADLCAAATDAERKELGLYCERHGEVLVLACEADQGILMNRCLGFEPGSAARLEEIIAVYRQRNIARAFFSVDEEHAAELGPLLEQHGLVRARPWVKFCRDAAPAIPASTELSIRRIGSGDGEDFGRITCNAFDLPPGFIPILARLPEREHWQVFMSFDGDTPAGCGSVHVRGESGWVGFGATDPAFRQRGSQTGVMAARIEQARALGATLLHTETGEAVPGDPQHSYRNIEKAGFRPSHRIINFALDG